MEPMVAAGDQREHADIEGIAVVLRPGPGIERFKESQRAAAVVHLVRQVEKADVVVIGMGMVPGAHAGEQDEERHAAQQRQPFAPHRHAASTALETS